MKSPPIEIQPHGTIDAEVSIPGSKSCTARALVMAGLTQGESRLLEPADCDDSDYMVAGLQALGLEVEKSSAAIRVFGRPFKSPAKPLFLGNSGTAVRFLTAACATLDGQAVIDGSPRMRERPITDLLEALQLWGVSTVAPTGSPPVAIRGAGVFGGTTRVHGGASSQYLTGLLMAAPCAAHAASIEIEGDLVSKPYIDLTLAMMKERGVVAENMSYARFDVPPGQRYAPGTYAIEADASGASYFLSAAAIAGGRVRVKNLSFDSQQGDAQFARVLEKMGCAVTGGEDFIEVQSHSALRGIDVDLNDMPDMAQTLAVTALFAEGPTTIRNVHNLRIKETDRISATVAELGKLGAKVDEYEDGLRVTPGVYRGGDVETYDDHRMAMSFSLAGLRIPGVRILDPDCVRKTFPDYFARFGKLLK